MLRGANRFRSHVTAQVRVMSSAPPSLPECEFEPQQYKGPTYDNVLNIRSKFLSPTKQAIYKKPLLLTQGKMQWLWDDTGKRYLDMFAGIVTVSVGHCNPTVSEALKKQIDTLWHTTNIYMNPQIHEYAEKLAATMPGDLKVCFFTNSGSEANDLAMSLAREYTKAFDVISFANSYHGDSPYTVGLTAHATWKHSYANGFGIHHAMNPDPYRGIWGGSKCRDSFVQTDRVCDCAVGECMASDKYFEQLENMFKYTVKKPAALFAESIQGVGGVVQFPKGFLKRAFDLVRSKGGLCVSDEVQSGFGRTGDHFWGFQGHGVVPDIVSIAKGVGNGFPLGAVVTTPEVVSRFVGAHHLNTYSGNPLASSVGGAVLDVMATEGTQRLCRDLGEYLIEELAKLKAEFKFVGDVRGKGLMLGVEMVQDCGTREPMDPAKIATMWEDMKDMGLLVGKGGFFGNVFRIKPPMCVTKEDCDFTVAVMRKAFADFKG